MEASAMLFLWPKIYLPAAKWVSHKNTQRATKKYKATDNTDLHGSCKSFFVGAVDSQPAFAGRQVKHQSRPMREICRDYDFFLERAVP
jgi:hypothetical protein